MFQGKRIYSLSKFQVRSNQDSLESVLLTEPLHRLSNNNLLKLGYNGAPTSVCLLWLAAPSFSHDCISSFYGYTGAEKKEPGKKSS